MEMINLLKHFECLKEVKSWMNNNFLWLNKDKTEIIIFGPNSSANDIAGRTSIIEFEDTG